ncbi:MAG: 2-succinyl-5-enolpyruvyl-6-hydroxy-3-cyclohexene-1-carboxylic-acid synthase [Bacteroidota bacterium]
MQHLQHIAELGPLLERLNIGHVIIAPGSRNAPLTQLFTGSESFKCHSIVDERSAGYVALGMARQLQQPVVVVTTSGTAVLNLGPAVAEAFYQKVPLIVLTADRPQETIWQFNNQVIDQMAPFFNYSRGFYEFPLELRSEQEMKQALSAVEHLILVAVDKPGGPVHINIPLEEPLYESLPDPLFSGMDFENESYPMEQDSLALEPLAVQKKIMVLAGMGVYDQDIRSILEKLTSSGQLILVAENLANMASDQFIANPELVLAGASEEVKRELAPDLVIAFGGQVVSKRLKQFIQSLKGVKTRVIEGNPLLALKELEGLLNESGEDTQNSFLQSWKRVGTSGMERATRFLGKAPFCNLTSVDAILSSIPENSVVHLGNSTTVRNSQLMPVRPTLSYYSNRGTSGIDGCVSTAVGAALVSDQLHVLLVGDLSFVYDSNSLWNQKFPQNLKIVILNDGGGGIFRLLEGPDRMEFFEEFSVTHHPVSLELLSQSFGRSYQMARNKEELIEKLALLYQPGSSLSILEVNTSDSENSRIFKEFFKPNP